MMGPTAREKAWYGMTAHGATALVSAANLKADGAMGKMLDAATEDLRERYLKRAMRLTRFANRLAGAINGPYGSYCGAWWWERP